MATTSFQLGETLDTYIAGKIESGEFKTKADVVRYALNKERRRDEAREALLAYVQEGIDSGLVDMEPEELFEDIKRRGREALARKTGAA
ncbi:MAG: type II toxin-antitoxin system ParD family antitoxin [Litorimonas sp.]